MTESQGYQESEKSLATPEKGKYSKLMEALEARLELNPHHQA
jgi:hypothetical protein